MNKKTKRKYNIKKRKIGKKFKKRTIKARANKNRGGGYFNILGKKKCSEKKIKEKYQLVFLRKHGGGAKKAEVKGEGKKEKKIELDPKCKQYINDLKAKYDKYLNEWKNL